MILTGIFGFMAGVAVGSLIPISFSYVLAVFFCGLVCIACGYGMSESDRRIIFFSFIFLTCCAVGMTRAYLSDAYRPSTLSPYADKKISAEGIVVEEPDVRERATRLTIDLRNIKVATTTVPVRERVILSAPLYPEFSYGDLVAVNTTLVSPDNIASDDGRVFDYAGYLRARGIWYIGKFPKISLVSRGHGSIVKEILFRIKHSFTGSIDRVLPAPESSLLSGLLLGTKQALGADLLNQFSRAGLSHVVVLSGYNIAIVAESIMAVLGFLPAIVAFTVGCVGIISFTVLSGGGASAVRAAVMVLVALFAKKTNRQYSASRALGLAVVIMLAWNPLLLVFDPSFQLSILATVGIIFVSPVILPYFSRIPEKLGLREIVSSTVATQAVVLPFLVYNTGIISIVSLPANVLVLGVIPITMFFGFVTGIAGFISLYLSYIPAVITYGLLWYELGVVHASAALPFGSVSLPAFSFWIVTIVYALIGWGLYMLHARKP